MSLSLPAVITVLAPAVVTGAEVREIALNQGWSFHRIELGEVTELAGPAVSGTYDDGAWERVSLPHPVRIESPNCGSDYFKGECWYRRVIAIPPEWGGTRVSAVFDGAMQRAEIWVNGRKVAVHLGGYLPFSVDLTPYLAGNRELVLALRLDNRSSPEFPPGSDRIDFAYFGGLYRPARLVVTGSVHLTDAIAAKQIAAGGVFVRYENVSEAAAEVLAQASVRNDGAGAADVAVSFALCESSGRRVAAAEVKYGSLAAGKDTTVAVRMTVKRPQLWHPDHPNLYQLVTEVKSGGKVLDRVDTRCGIRHLNFTDDGFFINGKKLVLRGANRHQSFPWLGNAAPDSMHYRDIRLLKEAGFNFVRLAHYPQSTAVMDACDELGVMALVCTPGWQFFANNDSFRDQARANIRDMVRWHRNHPSAVLWEVSLNETYGQDAFYAECAAIARTEYPGGQLFTCGDSHGSNEIGHFDLTYTEWSGFYKRPLHKGAKIGKGLHREYGDYEFGGQASTTRVPRGAGEEKLLMQAWNFQWAHNRNLSWSHTIGDAIWAGIDNLSTFDKLDTSGSGLGSWWGPLDLHRLPKFSYYFYQSQRDPGLSLANSDSGPMVRIAGYWTPRPSPAKVVVFSNCDEIELILNGKSIARQKPDSGPDADYGAYRPEADPMYWTKKQDTFEATKDAERNAKGKAGVMFDGGNCRHLDHPPFTFVPVAYEPGTLKAVAYRNGKQVAEHVLRTPGRPSALRLRAPELGRPLRGDGGDALLVYAEVVDASGEIVPDANVSVRFGTRGAGSIVTPATVPAEAGVASAILRAGTKPGPVTLCAEAEGLTAVELTIEAR
jgi:beta-galactosidase